MKGWEAGSGGRGYIYLRLIHTVVQQKATQHCKAIILQLKINFKKYMCRNAHLGTQIYWRFTSVGYIHILTTPPNDSEMYCYLG